MPDDLLMLGVIWFAIFIFSTTLHEAAHAWAALHLGDPTGYQGGQVSLDPTPHIQREPIGMLLAPLVSFFFFYHGGWMIGWAHCPYDPFWAMTHPRRAAWMALAGPVANLLLCLLAAFLLRIGLEAGYFERPMAPAADRFLSTIVSGRLLGISNGVAVFLSVLFSWNLICFVFNLFPLPPLDGGAVILLFLPRDAAAKFQSFLWDPSYQMIGLVAASVLAPKIIMPVFSWACDWIYAGGAG